MSLIQHLPAAYYAPITKASVKYATVSGVIQCRCQAERPLSASALCAIYVGHTVAANCQNVKQRLLSITCGVHLVVCGHGCGSACAGC